MYRKGLKTIKKKDMITKGKALNRLVIEGLNNSNIRGKVSFYVICLLAIISFNSCQIFHHHSAVTYNKGMRNAPFDAIIVPGLPYDSGKINPLLKARILWAKELYDKGITKHIIFSGSAVHSPFVEGAIMKLLADSLGIPAHHTFIEDMATHSTENVSLGVTLANKMCFKKIAIATDPIQCIMLKNHLKLNHADVSVLPFSLKQMAFFHDSQLPSVNIENAYVENFISLKNRETVCLPILD